MIRGFEKIYQDYHLEKGLRGRDTVGSGGKNTNPDERGRATGQ